MKQNEAKKLSEAKQKKRNERNNAKISNINILKRNEGKTASI
jgi:hypothetical protein